MARMILLLNVVVLLVNFAVAWGATDSQIGILDSAARARSVGGRSRDSASLDYLRVVQSLDGVLTPERAKTLDASALQAVYDALEGYRFRIETGVPAALASGSDAETVRRSLANLGREARVAVEMELGRTFRDQQLVTHLTNAILRN